MNKAIELIQQQQAGKDNTPAFVIGLHLIDMMKTDSRIEPILEEDLQSGSMGLEMCAAALKKRADEIHRNSRGDCVVITPPEAEKIIRKFYGLPDPEEAKPEEPGPSATGIIELEDLL